jgi:molecular chaperone GrpE (heat shock protein)
MSKDNNHQEIMEEKKNDSLDNSINLEQYNQLKEEYAQLEKKHRDLDETYQKMLRTAAHIQNLYNEIKEKSIKDLEREKKKTRIDIFSAIIKFIDMLELTLNSINQQKTNDKSMESIVSGINMVYKYILSDLENKFKLKKIQCQEGDFFDSQIHEAQKKIIIDDKEKNNTIARIVSGGYYLDGDILNNPIVDVYSAE